MHVLMKRCPFGSAFHLSACNLCCLVPRTQPKLMSALALVALQIAQEVWLQSWQLHSLEVHLTTERGDALALFLVFTVLDNY